jgi:hypothetical protein
MPCDSASDSPQLADKACTVPHAWQIQSPGALLLGCHRSTRAVHERAHHPCVKPTGQAGPHRTRAGAIFRQCLQAVTTAVVPTTPCHHTSSASYTTSAASQNKPHGLTDQGPNSSPMHHQQHYDVSNTSSNVPRSVHSTANPLAQATMALSYRGGSRETPTPGRTLCTKSRPKTCNSS